MPYISMIRPVLVPVSVSTSTFSPTFMVASSVVELDRISGARFVALLTDRVWLPSD